VRVTIVGSGPSLLKLTPTDFEGPVIALNTSIVAVRKLGLPNLIYTMQKDGCNVPHGKDAAVPLDCVCPSPWMVPPELPEVLLLSAAESPRCFAGYPLRRVIDVEAEFGLPWFTMSAPVAVRIAAKMGATEVRMLGMDGYTRRDGRRYDGRGLQRLSARPYAIAGRQSLEQAKRCGVAISFAGV